MKLYFAISLLSLLISLFCVIALILIRSRIFYDINTLQNIAKAINGEIDYLKERDAVNVREISLVHSKIDTIRLDIHELQNISEEDKRKLEEKIAESIEKKWDAGLQSIMDFNPLTIGRSE